MEQEYKWDLPRAELAGPILRSTLLEGRIISCSSIDMSAVYYDTPDGLMMQKKGALRIRRENEVSICCLKLPVSEDGACTVREEYEVPARTTADGLAALPGQGAPSALCQQLSAADLVPLCQIDYRREAYGILVSEGGEDCTAELTVDLGQSSHGDRRVPISEMEFEYHSGSLPLFHSFAARMESCFRLTAQPLSKLARAMEL